MNDYLVRATGFNNSVRIFAVRCTNTLEEARLRHDMWPSVTAGIGRTMAVAAMMSAMFKNDEELLIRLDGQGQAGIINVEANAKGDIIGYAEQPHVDVKYNNGKINVSYAVGTNGSISVTKDLKLKETYTSTSPIQTGEIGEDFAYYFTVSEQTPSAVSVGVLVHEDNYVISAGGLIIQIMPNCPEEIISIIEENLGKLKPVSELIGEGTSPEEIIKIVTNNDCEILETRDIRFKCKCSKEKFARGIISLGKDEVQKIFDEEFTDEIHTECHFCTEKYVFTKDEIEELFNG